MIAVRHRAATAAVIAAVLVGASCSDVDEAAEYRELAAATSAQRVFAAIPVGVDDAYRVVARDGEQVAEVLRSATGSWQPGEGATDVGAAMMAEAEDVLLPTLAYRRLPVDATDPQFGLVEAEVVLAVETRTAEEFRLRIGGPTPNGGGYYAGLDGDARVYVVIPQVLDYVRSIAIGDRVVRPMSEDYAAALAAVDETGESEEVTNPWLAQVLQAAGGTS